MGGIVKAVIEGYPQREIAKSAYEYQLRRRDPDHRSEHTTGGREARIRTARVDPEVRRRVIERLEEYRRQRDRTKVEHLLSRLAEEAERSEVNLFPTVLECVRAGTTLGEISDTLRDVWGRMASGVLTHFYGQGRTRFSPVSSFISSFLIRLNMP